MEKVLHKEKNRSRLIGLDIFCFVRFVRAEYFRDNDYQISEFTINKCWHVYEGELDWSHFAWKLPSTTGY